MPMSKIEAIQHKLNYLRETVNFDKNLEVFNEANGNADLFDVVAHRYYLDSRLSEAEIVSFEKRFAIALPEDYRAFLLEIGNGGAGPYYGLYTLVEGLEKAEWKASIGMAGDDSEGVEETLDEIDHVLARPFPLTMPYIRPEYAGETAMDVFLENVNLPTHVQGTLPVADFGCGIDTLLVITGAARGTLWLDDRHSDSGVWPLCMVDGKIDFSRGFDIGFKGNVQSWQGCDFVTWYEDWLDERIDIHARYKRGEWRAPWTEARRNPQQTSMQFRGKTSSQ